MPYKDPADQKAAQAASYQRNKAAVKERLKQWRRANPEAYAAQRKREHERRKAARPERVFLRKVHVHDPSPPRLPSKAPRMSSMELMRAELDCKRNRNIINRIRKELRNGNSDNRRAS